MATLFREGMEETLLQLRIALNIDNTASFAPPWAGPHKADMPAATQAYGLAPVEPTSLTVEVLAFCS